MLFLLLNVVLCLIGTFWYRVNIRKEEIGLRIAIGSDRKGIMKLFCMEGLCLLSVVVIPAVLIEFQLVNLELTLMPYGREHIYWGDNSILRFIVTNLLTILIIGMTLLLSILIPAKKAASLMPADSLRYE